MGLDRTERCLSSERVLEGNFLQVWRDQVRLPDGKTASREYIKHPGAVVIVALLDDGRAVIERQYRYAVGRDMLEFPAGKLDATEIDATQAQVVGEPSAGVWACARRELAEETGFCATQWAYAGAMHNAIGYSNEVIHICFARGLQAGADALDDGEFLEVAFMSHDDLMRAQLQHRLTDAKTITALSWWQHLRSGLWQPTWLRPDQSASIARAVS